MKVYQEMNVPDEGLSKMNVHDEGISRNECT
jgi:hypothetical protein